MRTLLEILNLSVEYLKKKEVEESRFSSELILTKVLNIKRLDIYLQYDRILTENEISKIRALLIRRSKHEPIQYIIGEVEFYGLNFKVNNSVLIPRSDTEILVETAVDFIGDKTLNILEIGTGSGCIAVSLAYACKNVNISATDISDEALKIAEKNAKLNGVGERITFVRQDILKSVPKYKYDIIISNPPYISLKVIDALDKQVKDYEPVEALTDNKDGLTFYRRINEIIPQILKADGSVFLEIGYDQAEAVKAIYEKSLTDIKILRDYSNNNRVFIGKLK
ncbi:MAG: peptide chain release factor N(5)-glutamine methyltransferase [Candidatus Delongbacteria bacterium]|nr:peptide chain release factor N(5)-glutamine methyltransferase [Candidatus Delongbacteria bacterium]MCG2760520.1 peptide chain release factor N(5)-glutamine methyltransferase [Candidatus Delongbacteria bacterium]